MPAERAVGHRVGVVVGMGDKRAYLDGQGFKLIQRGEYVGRRYAYFDSQARLGAILELLEQDGPGEVEQAAR